MARVLDEQCRAELTGEGRDKVLGLLGSNVWAAVREYCALVEGEDFEIMEREIQ
jgi:hypothetical protein